MNDLGLGHALQAAEILNEIENSRDVSDLQEESAELLTQRIELFATFTGDPMSDWESWVLRNTLASVAAYEQENPTLPVRGWLTYAMSKTVYMARAAIVHDLHGLFPKPIKVAPGVTIPMWWEAHYEVIYTTDCPLMISPAMQNVFLGDPLAGETKPWKVKP